MTATSEIVVFASELGWMGLSWSRHGIFGLTFGNRTRQEALRRTAKPSEPHRPPPQPASELIERLRAYAAGHPDDFLDVKLDLVDMTPFQQRVIRCCRQIRFGQTATYQQLAAGAGSPAAARAVGNIMARNRTALIVPCHRVIAASGGLGGYSAPDGLDMKRRLLALESLARPHGPSSTRVRASSAARTAATRSWSNSAAYER